MDNYDNATYGDRVAEFYDDLYDFAPSDDQLRLLTELAGDGDALELGIGTGRVALPLAARGVSVHGIDSSQAMVDRLRDKPGGDAIEITIGDFGEVAVDGQYRLIYITVNTFFSLPTQEDQISCFRGVAAHLTEDGTFLIEAFVPDLARFDRGQRTSTNQMSIRSVILDTSILDPATQRIDSTHVLLTDGQPVRLLPVSLRYAWPSELDLMARLAGLRLRYRHAGWDGQPFDGDSSNHVSVWELDNGR